MALDHSFSGVIAAMTTRRLPPSWSVEELDACFVLTRLYLPKSPRKNGSVTFDPAT
jgi:hypothetical protein